MTVVRADALSRRHDYINDKEMISRNILRINKDGSLSANVKEFNATLRVIRDDQEEYLVSRGKLEVPQDRIRQCI